MAKLELERKYSGELLARFVCNNYNFMDSVTMYDKTTQLAKPRTL